jgi:hypothetical protein
MANLHKPFQSEMVRGTLVYCGNSEECQRTQYGSLRKGKLLRHIFFFDVKDIHSILRLLYIRISEQNFGQLSFLGKGLKGQRVKELQNYFSSN